jgi:hypothetical protein
LGHFTEDEEAQRLGVTVRTLRSWRAKKYGPTPTIIGRFIYYSETAERAFIESCRKPLVDERSRRRGRRAA